MRVVGLAVTKLLGTLGIHSLNRFSGELPFLSRINSSSNSNNNSKKHATATTTTTRNTQHATSNKQHASR